MTGLETAIAVVIAFVLLGIVIASRPEPSDKEKIRRSMQKWGR